MGERCYECFRPKKNCLCEYKDSVDSGIKFVILMHPKEFRKQRTGTGHIAKMILKDAELLVGLDFSRNARLGELLSDPRYFPVLLYPGESAWTAETPALKEAKGARTVLALLVDATWFCARKVLEHSPFLLDLPRVSFYGGYKGEYVFKREPRPECLATIEACHYLVKEFQAHGMANPSARAEPLMEAFHRLVREQLQAQRDRIAGLLPDSHAYDWKYRKMKE